MAVQQNVLLCHQLHLETSAFSFLILIIKSTRCIKFSNLFFWSRTLHVSGRFSVHHQEPSAVYTATGICHTDYADCSLAGTGWSSILILISITCMSNTYCCVYSARLLMIDRKPVRNIYLMFC